LAACLYWGRRFSDALAAAQEARTLNPEGGQDITPFVVGSYLALGKLEIARQLCESPATPLSDVLRREFLAIIYRALGDPRRAESELTKLKAIAGESGAFMYAEVYAQAGNAILALQWLATAEREHHHGLALLKVDPMLDPIRNAPQFKALEKRLNFPP
jgi:tetratricopeptide (TPR) repeat protein